MNAFPCLSISMVALALIAAPAGADVITQYEFNSAALTPQTTIANATATAITGGPNTAVAQSNGFYVSAPFMIASRNNNTADNHYWQFTVTAADGYELDLTSFTFDGARGGGAAPRSYSVRSSVGGTGLGDADLGSGEFTTQRPGSNTAGATLPTITIDLGDNHQDLQSVTFRVYFATPDVQQNIDIDNVTVNGVVSPIPEPASLGLLALGGVVMLARRR